jgi:hypothetical protein
MRPKHATTIIAAAGLALTIAPVATAQNALGDGRALDNNLNTNSGGVNPGGTLRDFRAEVEFRNAIVTGNVGGGSAFRGFVGYSASDDFRDPLGTNLNFDFYRDSYSAGLATQNLSGIDALRSNLAWSVAGQTDAGLGGRVIINRDGVGATAGNVYGQPREGDNIRLDPLGAIAGSIRSPSTFTLRNATTPSVLGLAVAQDDTRLLADQAEQQQEVRVVTASSLLGIKPLPQDSELFGIRTDQDMTNPRSNEDEVDDEQSGSPNRVVPERVSDTVTTHQRIISTIAESRRVTPQSPNQLQRVEPDAAEDGEGDGEEFVSPETEVERLLQELREMLEQQPEETGSSSEEGDDEEQDDRPLTPEEEAAKAARELLDAVVPEVGTLDPTVTSNSLYNDHMKRGAELLRTERWFVAEERFTAALTVRPGDPLAAAGRVHAQLGAGMFLSASVNLRNLLRGYPEFIPVRFDDSLMPGERRQQRILAQLRQRMERDTNVGYDAALLLAYMGWQMDDNDIVREAFDTLERIGTAINARRDPLNAALRAVWLDEDE